MTEEQAKHNKHLVFLRGLLTGMGYFMPLRALELAREYHVGLRKDGKTPEFQHQVEILEIFSPVLVHCANPRIVVAGTMLHDTPEDYAGSEPRIEKECGYRVAQVARGMNKTGMTMEEYCKQLAEDEDLSILKGGDRLHNTRTMQCFTDEKIAKYIKETREHILPMLKKARRNFPHQSLVYVYLSQGIEANLRWAEALLQARA